MLRDRLRARIAAEGPLRVRDAMELALYDPEEGYYARGPAIGAPGDFYTSSSVSLFPAALARFVRAALERLGEARVVELGAGEGELAGKLGVDVTVVEPSVGLARRQQARGLQVVAALDELRPAPTLFIANEVLDALPVHRLVMTSAGIQECYLDADLREVAGPLTPSLSHAAARLAPLLPEGAKAEVNAAAEDLLASMARVAPRALALFLDYGGTPGELYGEHHPDGTLRGFRAHRVVAPFEAPGEQDVTADVDFPWVAEVAARHGWTQAGYATQGRFLGDLGLVDDLSAALAKGETQAYLAGKNLLLPGGMGERFHALLLARDVATAPALPGFRPAWR